MATSGCYYGSAFTFNYSFVQASDPTAFFTGSFTSGEVKVITRDGATTNAAANIATLPTHESNGVFEINLSASETSHDEIIIVLVPSAADVVVESISITTEPTPVDVIEVSSDATAADNLESQYDGTGLTGNNYPAKQVDLATVDANVDAVLVDTGTTLPATLATIDSNVDAVLVDTGTTIPGTIATVDANVDSILVDTGTTIPAQISGLEAKVDTVDANVDAVLVDTGTTIPGTIATVDANVDAILVDTGTTIPASIATVDANVDSILVDTGTTLPATLTAIEGKVDTVDTVADSIKVDTTAILDDTGTSGVTISTAQAQAIADEILKRSVSTGEATAAEHSLATIILSILESQRTNTVWTIKRSDGVTSHLTKTLTLDGTAQPVTGVSD